MWANEYVLPARTLRALALERCEAEAFLRWSRVPYVTAPDASGSRVLGDLRYDRNPGLDFSDVALPHARGRCPEYVPPWLPPRSDLLAEPSQPKASRAADGQ